MITFKIFEPFYGFIEHGVTTASEGDYAQGRSYAVFADQIHTDVILDVNERLAEAPKCDAFITRQNSLPLLIKIADCQAALIMDPVSKTIAAVHNGWRGSTYNILGKTIRRLKETHDADPANLRIGISPSLGPCCAEFTDPRNELPAFVHRYIQGSKVDFWQLSQDQCTLEGVPKAQIEIARKCTRCGGSEFFSHRNGNAERMAAFIMLT